MPPRLSIGQDIARMVEQASLGRRPLDCKRIELYAGGLVAKLREAEYALSRLREQASVAFVTTSTSESPFAAQEKLHFYVDSFFAFLYSSLDVLGQVVNQVKRLQLAEKAASFKQVQNKLPVNAVQKDLFERLSKTRKFTNLERFRNCSTHRRQIYLKTTQTLETPGYSSTGQIHGVKHILADNALDLNPTVRQERELVRYCDEMFDWASNEIRKIVNSL